MRTDPLTQPLTAMAARPVAGHGRAAWNASLNAGNPGAGTVLSRASNATCYTSSGTLVTAATNGLRFDYDPITLAAKGLLIEGARSNGIRNSEVVGGAVNTNPTNWSGRATVGGITTEIAAVGRVNGIAYMDWRISGTATAAGGSALLFETSTGITASNAQVWTLSGHYALVSGTLAGFTLNQRIRMQDSGGTDLGSLNGALFAPDATLRRRADTLTVTSASTTNVRPMLNLAWVNGAVIDATIRVAAPQCELGAFASSYIPTTGVAVTRAADICSVKTMAGMGYTFRQGTLYVEAVPMATNAGWFASLDDGSGVNRIAIGTNASGQALFSVTAGGVSRFNQAGVTVAANTTYRSALAFNATGFAAVSNGGTVYSGSGGAPVPGILQLGNSGYTTPAYGWIRKLSYLPECLPPSQLQAMTA